jgi:hypothetical protein
MEVLLHCYVRFRSPSGVSGKRLVNGYWLAELWVVMCATHNCYEILIDTDMFDRNLD